MKLYHNVINIYTYIKSLLNNSFIVKRIEITITVCTLKASRKSDIMFQYAFYATATFLKAILDVKRKIVSIGNDSTF